MRRRGINYDTGFFPGGRLSRERFDPETVRQEMAVIAGELHCDAVRLSCGDAEVVFVTGCELSLFAAGFLPGENAFRRIEGIMSGDPAIFAAFGDIPGRVNAGEDGVSWEPKEIFHALAEAYSR